eukprot:9312662-Alexandrium_andersonii.AAC.1
MERAAPWAEEEERLGAAGTKPCPAPCTTSGGASWLESTARAMVQRSGSLTPGAASGGAAPAAAVVRSVASLRGGRSVAARVASVRSSGARVCRSASVAVAGRLPVGRRRAGRGNVEEGGRGWREAPSVGAKGAHSVPSS